MALIRFHKNPFRDNPRIETHSGDLLDCIMAHDWCRAGIVVDINGVQVADSGKLAPSEMVKALTVSVGTDDTVDVFARPFGIESLSWWVIAAIAGGAAVVAYALMPKPKLPGDVGNNDTSANNQLNAAQNSFRPNQAIPDNAGQSVSYPDFVQPSFYIYRNNRRVFTELMCFGIGRYDVAAVKDGESLFDDLSASTYTVYDPTDTIPTAATISVLTAEGSEDFPMPATDDETRTAIITNGSFGGSSNIFLGDDAAQIIADLGLASGNSIEVNATYELDGVFSTVDLTLGITSVGATSITVTPAVLPTAEPLSVNGTLIQTSGGASARWFTLPGNAIETIRFQLKMPQGIRKGDGTIAAVNYLLEWQELDGSGAPIGSSSFAAGTFSGNTLEPQYITRDVATASPSRYRARAVRTTPTLGDNAVDLLLLERVESVTPYSAANFGNVTCALFERATAATQGRSGSTKINALVTRKLELFNFTTKAFATGVFTATRSYAQYVMYLLSNRGKVALSLINSDELSAIEDSLAMPELGYFDYSNDSFNVSLRERVTAALNAARCYHYMQGAVWRFGREEEKEVRSFVINRRNLIPGSYSMNEQMRVTNSYDSIELVYVDPTTNSEESIKLRIGTGGVIEEGEGVRSQRINLAGCRNYNQANNRAQLEIRKIKYIRRALQCRTLPDIIAAGIGERGGVINPAGITFVSGEVLGIDGLTLTLSEPVTVSGFVYFVLSDGTVTNPVSYTRVSDYVVTVGDATGLYLANGYDVQAGSKFVASEDNDFSYGDYVLVKRGTPDSAWRVPIELAQYDGRVFDFDNLPPPPEPLELSFTDGSASVLNASCVTVSPTATVTAVGGTGSYTYAWSKLSGAGSIASGGTTATVTVDFTSVCPEDLFTGSYRCTVTSGEQVETIDILFSAENTAIDPTPDPLSVEVFGGNKGVPDASCINISASATAVASGGGGSYTYSWTKISGSGSITSGAATDTLTVTFTSVCPEVTASGVYRVTASDGTDTVTFDKTFTATNTQPLG